MEGCEGMTPLTFALANLGLRDVGVVVSTAALASHDYILKIVPTVYEDLSGKQKFSYQYTVANKVLLVSL